MNQLRKAKSRNPRRHAVLPRKYIKVVVTYVLLFAIVFSNMSNPLLNVFAGQKKEEFRIHADELQRAAEEALEEGNIVEEPLDFYDGLFRSGTYTEESGSQAGDLSGL
jgi:hypothetical protein